MIPRYRHTLFALAACLLLASCGYHLVGQGGGSGAIPADVRTVSITVSGGDQKIMPQLRQRLDSSHYVVINRNDVTDAESHAVIRVTIAPVRFVPSAYDAAGVANQYSMVFSGSLAVERKGETIWQSGTIQQQGNVYVSGGPTSIEASRERLLKDLRKQWLQDAVGRLRSGF